MSDVVQGRAGGLGGNPFEGYIIPEGARLSEVHVFAGQYVHAIQFVYVNADGSRGELSKVGGDGGQHHQFVLETDEYVTAVSGLADWYVDQVRFHTNRRVSPSFGAQGTAQAFQLDVAPDHMLVGLYGSADWYLDSIGLLGRPLALGSAAAPAVPAPKPAARKPAARKPAAAPAASGEAKPKDLEKVEGIGPKIAALLVENGIRDLGALAAAPLERIKAILAAAGSRYAIADPTSWPEQAALGACGDWDGLAALQKQLKGGRRS